MFDLLTFLNLKNDCDAIIYFNSKLKCSILTADCILRTSFQLYFLLKNKQIYTKNVYVISFEKYIFLNFFYIFTCSNKFPKKHIIVPFKF